MRCHRRHWPPAPLKQESLRTGMKCAHGDGLCVRTSEAAASHVKASVRVQLALDPAVVCRTGERTGYKGRSNNGNHKKQCCREIEQGLCACIEDGWESSMNLA